jgi:quercetin dioxygenase-like cupin family protein
MEAQITERISANIFIREVHLAKKGDSIPGHIHRYDHTMFFMKGKAKLRVIQPDGSETVTEIAAPVDVLVEKQARHEITAVSDNVYFCCVFPHRDMQGNITDEPVTRDAYL